MKTIRQLLAAVLLALPAAMTAQDTEIWVSFVDNPNRESNGIYGFPASDPQALTAKKTAPELYFQKGTGYQDGTIYGMDYKQGFFTPDRYILYAVDTKTWSVTSRDVSSSLALKETANGADGTVYALFDDGRLGTLDYKTLTRTDIATPQRSYAALGVTGMGELYGIDSDANLVSINTTTGAETVVGSTGLSIYGYGRTTGEIDPVTGKFYLAAQSGWSESLSIYAIDLQSCEATTMGQLPAGYDYLGGMIIVGEPAAAGAPGRATNLKATFEGNALTGTLSFTAPTTTFDHQPLEGELAYTVSYGSDGQQSLTGMAQPGADVSLPITLSEGGLITFAVKFANAAGEGQTATITQWVGPDAPLTPDDVELTMDADGRATLSWTAPTGCVNDGYLGTLTYDVWRIVSGEETLVAQGLSATTFSEQLEITTLKEYSYAVVALNDGTPSERALSNKIIAGDGFGVPFTEQFGEGNRLEYFTVVNVNHDEDRWGELTWKLHTDMNFWGQGTNYEEMWIQTDGATDDWLITPPLQLKANTLYALTFKMKAGYDTTPEKFEVRMGQTATPEAMTTPLLSEQTITNTEYKTFTREFTVQQDGTFCIGFHATRNQGAALYLDDVAVRVATSQEAPAAPSCDGIIAGEEGELKATITFTTPALTIGAEPLKSLTRVEVLRDEALIATIDAPEVNTAYTIVDEQPSNGYHAYAIVAYNEAGRGQRAEQDSVYVGVDIPKAPIVSRTEDLGRRVRFEWAEAETEGQRGYYVRPADVVYEVYATDAQGQRSQLVYEGSERSFEADYDDTDAFDIVKYLIVARNVAGTSREGTAKMATGTPLTLPYRESFAMGRAKNSFWVEQTGLRSWNPTTEDAAGEDAGSLLFVPYDEGDGSTYCTQRLTFIGVRQPQLSFWHKLQGATLDVVAWRPDGNEVPLCALHSTASEPSKWSFTTVEVPLQKDQPYTVLKFKSTGQAGSRALIDDILVCDGAYADGIATVVNGPAATGHALYDLQGRRVSQPAKGLYIYNGKKIIK